MHRKFLIVNLANIPRPVVEERVVCEHVVEGLLHAVCANVAQVELIEGHVKGFIAEDQGGQGNGLSIGQTLDLKTLHKK